MQTDTVRDELKRKLIWDQLEGVMCSKNRIPQDNAIANIIAQRYFENILDRLSKGGE